MLIFICFYDYVGSVDPQLEIAIEDTRNNLQASYETSKYCSSQSKHYTTLAFVRSGDKSSETKVIHIAADLAVAGNVAQTSVPSTPVIADKGINKDISTIFLPVPPGEGYSILIEGAPGIGKTVLTTEIAFLWAKDKLLKNIVLMFRIFLRECIDNNIKSITDLIRYITGTSPAGCLESHIIKTNGEGIAFVFDGYDEISNHYREKSFIARIIERQMLLKCCLVITSRPTASSNLRKKLDCTIHLLGFSEEDRLDYIQASLKEDDDVKDKEVVTVVSRLQQYLKQYPSINALCYIPLNMAILLSLAKKDRLPKTHTEMYKRFIEMTIERFITKVEEENEQTSGKKSKAKRGLEEDFTLEKLSNPYKEMFNELTLLAFDALEKDKIVFTLSEIKEHFHYLTDTKSEDNWNGLGLLKAVRCNNILTGKEDVIYHFAHFSIQEYMAAYYISKLPDKRQIKLLKQTFWEDRYYNAWIIYVGITNASSFALKHFLSGNAVQLFTKLSSNLTISSRLLNHKIKCLHLFQCLAETQNENVKSLAGKFLKDQEIDLSNQTLLPTDLNTFSYFLTRSITNKWQVLNLSGCNIGVAGFHTLYNNFFNKESQDIITVEKVDLSCNQITLSCLPKLFALLKSWGTSELVITDGVMHNDSTSNKSVVIITDGIVRSDSSGNRSELVITDDVICDDVTSNSLFDAIQDAFIRHDALKSVQIGDFVNKNHDYSKSFAVREHVSMYLVKCSLNQDITEMKKFLALLQTHKLTDVHIIDTPWHDKFVEEVAVTVLDNPKISKLFVYNKTLSDYIACKLYALAASKKKKSDAMLAIGDNVIAGSLRMEMGLLGSKLSTVDVFNLCMAIRYPNKVHSWKKQFHFYGDEKVQYLINTIIDRFHIITFNNRLQISLLENDTMIVHNIELDECIASLPPGNNFSYAYLSKCNLSSYFYKTFFDHLSTLLLCNNHFSSSSVAELCSRLLGDHVLRDVFIHGTFDANINDLVTVVTHHCHNTSFLLVTNDMMVGHNPTTRQIAMAFQLNLSITVWKLPNCQVTDVFRELINRLTITPETTYWTELNFEGCNITDTDCDIIHQYLNSADCHSTVKTLNITSNKLTPSVIPTLTEIMLLWKVQECIIGKIDKNFHMTMNNQLCEAFSCSKSEDSICLSVVSCEYISHFVYNAGWNEVSLVDNQTQELYIINCHIPSVSLPETLSWVHGTKLLKLLVVKGTLSPSFLQGIFELYINTKLDFSIHDTDLNDITKTILDLISNYNLPYVNMSFALDNDAYLCGCNLHYQNQEDENNIALLVVHKGNVEVMHFVGSGFQAIDTLPISRVIQGARTLKRFGIDNYYIDDETVGRVTSILYFNSQLTSIYLDQNYLQTDNALKIIERLQNLQTLTGLSLRNNGINDFASSPLAKLFSKHTEIQKIDLSGNEFTACGTASIIQGLENHTQLETLCMANNRVYNTPLIVDVYTYDVHLEFKERDLEISGYVLEYDRLQISITDVHPDIPGNLNMTASILSEQFHHEHNVTTTQFAENLAKILFQNAKLKKIDLTGNDLQTKGCSVICKALQKISMLTGLYLGNNHISDAAADDIASVISQNLQIREIDLSENNLQSTGCIVICKALHTVSTLTKFYLSNNEITEKAANDIAAIFSKSTKIKELDLSGNHLQTAGCEIICKALQNVSTLTKLSLSNVVYDIEAVMSECQVEPFDFKKFTAIGTIRLKNSKGMFANLKVKRNANSNVNSTLTDSIADVLGCNGQLQELSVSGNDFQAADFAAVYKKMQNLSMLTKLDFSNNNFTDDAANNIAPVLYHNTQLRELNINGNNFQVSGISKITMGLQNTSTLTKLYMGNNYNISNEAVDDIADILSHNTKLEDLELQIKNLTVNSSRKISKALQHTSTLHKLIMANCSITSESADSIAAVLSHNTKLYELNLDGNFLQGAGINMIFDALKHTSSLVKLSIQDNHCTEVATINIGHVIHHNPGLKELNLQGNDLHDDGWKVIAEALQKTPVTKLNINNNQITDYAIDDIKAALEKNIWIREFYFQKNQFTKHGIYNIQVFIVELNFNRVTQTSLAAGCDIQ